MHPTIVVVNAELYCVQSTVEYIRTNLQNKHVITLQVTRHLFKHDHQISQRSTNLTGIGLESRLM